MNGNQLNLFGTDGAVESFQYPWELLSNPYQTLDVVPFQMQHHGTATLRIWLASAVRATKTSVSPGDPIENVYADQPSIQIGVNHAPA